MKKRFNILLSALLIPSMALAEKVMEPIIIQPHDKLSLRLYGQVNQAILYSYDGRESDVFFVTTNDNSTSRLGLELTYKANEHITLGNQYELGLRVNRSNKVSQLEQSTGSDIDIRKLEIYIDWDKYGKLSLGQGSMASDKTAKQDLSGTKVVANSNVSKLGGGLFFRTDDGTLEEDSSNPTVGSSFNNIDGFKRKSRLRYDTPTYKGFQLSTSAGEDNRYDAAIRYRLDNDTLKVRAAAAYTKKIIPIAQENRFDEKCNIDAMSCVQDFGVDGSFSILWQNGFNITSAGGYVIPKEENRKSAYYGYIKLGYIWEHFKIGETALSVDFGEYNHFSGDDNKAHTAGLAAVQYLNNWNLQIYTGVRWFALDSPDESYKNIFIGTVGAMFEF